MLLIEKKTLFIFGLVLLMVNACKSPKPVFSLEKLPLIPLPLSVKASKEVLTLKAIQSVCFEEDRQELKAMAQSVQKLWSDYTQYDLWLEESLTKDDNAIALEIDENMPNPEAYVLEIESDEISIKGASAEGIYRGIKTLEQILALSQIHAVTEFSSLPGGIVKDQPQYAYRGTMLDVARHFFSVDQVKRYIDLLSLYKINYLHFHLSDDQGWRIEIKSWPKLTEIGGQTQVGGGKAGYYTQNDYLEIVNYATQKFITIVPEIDLPGHTNAALASYAQLNCNGKATDLYTGIEVGFSSLCVDKEITYDFVDDVIREISEMTPGPYFHIGGDESLVTPEEDYIRFMNRTLQIVKQHNKTPMGWYELIAADIPQETLLQYWAKAEDFDKVIAKKSKILISSASYAYLDMKYDSLTSLGLSWAGYLPLKKAYDWDPKTLVSGLDPEQIVGLEAPLWTETIESFDDIAAMAFPRLLGHAEIGWTSLDLRNWKDYADRLSYHGKFLLSKGVKYHPAPSISWK